MLLGADPIQSNPSRQCCGVWWGEPAVSHRWTGWVWEITGWSSRLQETDHSRGSYRLYPNSIKENRRMSTCNQLDLQAPGSQPIMSKNLPDHWLWSLNAITDMNTSHHLMFQTIAAAVSCSARLYQLSWAFRSLLQHTAWANFWPTTCGWVS